LLYSPADERELPKGYTDPLLPRDELPIILISNAFLGFDYTFLVFFSVYNFLEFFLSSFNSIFLPLCLSNSVSIYTF